MESTDIEGLKKSLTEKQAIFCHEYVLDWNATRAARAAGYSSKTASVIGFENLSKPYLKAYIEAIKENHELNCGVSKTKQIKEYMKIAYSSFRDLSETWIKLEDFEWLKDSNPTVLDAIESVETKTETIRKDGLPDVSVEYVKVKLYSKIAALERIDKLLGYAATVKIEQEIKQTTDISQFTEEEKQVLLKIARKNEYQQK